MKKSVWKISIFFLTFFVLKILLVVHFNFFSKEKGWNLKKEGDLNPKTLRSQTVTLTNRPCFTLITRSRFPQLISLFEKSYRTNESNLLGLQLFSIQIELPNRAFFVARNEMMREDSLVLNGLKSSLCRFDTPRWAWSTNERNQVGLWSVQVVTSEASSWHCTIQQSPAGLTHKNNPIREECFIFSRRSFEVTTY